MVHDFATPEGQARLSHAMAADAEATAERKREQAEFEVSELAPWFKSLDLEHKQQLAIWVNENETALTLGLVRIIDRYNHEMDEPMKFDF